MRTINNAATYSNADLQQDMYWMQAENARLSADKEKRIKDVIQAAYGALSRYYSELAVIQSDPDLSQSGMQSRTDAAGQRAIAVITEISKPALAELDADVQRLEQALRRAAAGQADDTSRTLLKIEARQLAAQIDVVLLQPQYLALCESGDDNLTCEAIEQAPALGRLLPDDVLERGRIIRAAHMHPDQAEALRQACEARSILAAAVDQAKSTLVVPFRSAADIGAIVDDVTENGLAA